LSTFLSFGPDLPQNLPPDAIRVAGAPRRDGLVIEEEVAEVVHQLATLQGQWPRFTRKLRGDATTQVFVNPAFVRFAEAEPTGPKRGETNIRDTEIR